MYVICHNCIHIVYALKFLHNKSSEGIRVETCSICFLYVYTAYDTLLYTIVHVCMSHDLCVLGLIEFSRHMVILLHRCCCKITEAIGAQKRMNTSAVCLLLHKLLNIEF